MLNNIIYLITNFYIELLVCLLCFLIIIFIISINNTTIKYKNISEAAFSDINDEDESNNDEEEDKSNNNEEDEFNDYGENDEENDEDLI